MGPWGEMDPPDFSVDIDNDDDDKNDDNNDKDDNDDNDGNESFTSTSVVEQLKLSTVLALASETDSLLDTKAGSDANA